MSRLKILTIIGTRPEAIKMIPVVREINKYYDLFDHKLVTTAQHRQMLDQVFSLFGVTPDIDLGLMQAGQNLGRFAARALSALSELFEDLKPDAILIQGDTTTVTSAALAAFYQNIFVAHVEAGLRSFDSKNPYPEEMNRRIASCIAGIHFAPTERARLNLLHEGVEKDNIFVIGNTIIDALQAMPRPESFEDDRLNLIDYANKRVLLVTAHRRENHGLPLRSICWALKTIAQEFADVEIVYPVHLNPNVHEVVSEELRGVDRIHLVPPLSYVDLLRLMGKSYFILTDSGGIQEESPSLHKPVLVLRETTERPELIDAGGGKLVGRDAGRIIEESVRLLVDEQEYASMSRAENPFGDGQAARRLVRILSQRLLGVFQPPDTEKPFSQDSLLSGD